MTIAPFLLIVGCGGNSHVVPLPDFDPSGAAAQAMELHDADGDGFLAGEELDGAPGLKAAMRNLDSNKDEKVDSGEIEERIQAWGDMRIGLMTINCTVLLDGQPLEGAKITFEPEAFLADAIETAYGETGFVGSFRPKIPKDKRPAPNLPPGIQAGFYRVKISKMQGDRELIPERYNAQTTLGQQVSKDDYDIVNKQVVFRLKSK